MDGLTAESRKRTRQNEEGMEKGSAERMQWPCRDAGAFPGTNMPLLETGRRAPEFDVMSNNLTTF